MNGYYGVGTWLTYLNAISGTVGVFFALTNRPLIAVICLIVCGVCDMFDGTVAKMFDRDDRKKCYGVQIDSLSDLISFGMLPASIGYNSGLNSFPLILIPILYVLAALIRLAYFNVTEMELLNSASEGRKFYEGLPVTTSAMIFPLNYLLCKCLDWPYFIINSVLLSLVAIAFVSKFKVVKIKRILILIAFGIVGAIAILFLIKVVNKR